MRLFLLLISVVLCSLGAYAQQGTGRKVQTLVIDPGHGGRAPGTVHGGAMEKDIVLKVAQKFGKMVEENFSDVKVYYTREKDTDIGLAERGKFANDKKADLFVSIHCNAAADRSNKIIPSVRGSLTLVMSMENDDNNLDVAIRENEAILYEDNYEAKYAGFDPSSQESYILFSLMQHEHLLESIEFSNMLQHHYDDNTDIPVTRGVGRQNLMVLWNAAMPAVLTEIGFLTNPDERRYMTSDKGQDDIAKSLFNAFSEYKSKVEGRSRVVFMDAANDTVSISMPPARSVVAVEKPRPVEDGVVYMVQVVASSRKIGTDFADFRNYRSRGITEKRIGGLYKYYVGKASSFAEAKKIRKECARKFRDAFVVAFRGERQLEITDEMKN